MNIRERQELWEEQFLSPLATKSTDSKGRVRPEPPCDVRTCFQRDRDRIIHSKAFRRLKDKTQVFLSPSGDHYRTRLTHTLEVSQISRTCAKALLLNENLTEAIALGHDLGHTPFGHTGEAALDQVAEGGFSHDRQGLRVVDDLEKDGAGLNLTWEVRDGILNHQTSGSPATLEGKIVRLCDKIAYVNHDTDDAIRAKILKEDDIPKKYKEVLGFSVKERLNTMIHDLIYYSEAHGDIGMSDEVYEAMMGLRHFLFLHVYSLENTREEERKAINLLLSLYRYYTEHPDNLPDEYYARFKAKESLEMIVCDYIAGMTDRYAIRCFQKIYEPVCWDH